MIIDKFKCCPRCGGNWTRSYPFNNVFDCMDKCGISIDYNTRPSLKDKGKYTIRLDLEDFWVEWIVNEKIRYCYLYVCIGDGEEPKKLIKFLPYDVTKEKIKKYLAMM